MAAVTLRTLVSTIGLVVALLTATLIPGGYLYDVYSDTSDTLNFKARLVASRVAQFIYTHDTLWEYQQPRLADQVALTGVEDGQLQIRLFAAGDKPVLEEGSPPPDPVVSRRAAIVVAGTGRGYIELTTSFRDQLYGAGLVALLSALLGFGMYFALRTFPLRVLDRTMGALQETQRDLSIQNERFDTALTNMSQGLCMFDTEEKLVIYNRRFLEIFGLSPGQIRPGMKLPEMIGVALGSDKRPDAGVDHKLALERGLIGEGKAGSAVEHLPDGRSIAIAHRPAPNGGFVATFEDITERQQAEEKIEHLAHHDPLTDLLNRASFYERIGQALSALRRSESIAVLSIDLDHFKGVNDSLGHPVGDLLLKAAADRMRSSVRGEDFVARLGGDEFAIVQVLPSDHPPDVAAFATRLIEVLIAPYDLEGHQVVVGTSVGIAMAPNDGSEPDALMKNADLALYRAKADGGGVYRFFELEMDARMQARRALELDLRKAIVNKEFELYYQPIIDVKSGQVTSCEALIRWHHPDRGMVPPMEFIAVAEETGLIVPLGEWILQQACADAAHWPDHITIAVNLSPAQFKSKHLLAAVKSALSTSGLAAKRLELEITELVLLQDNEGAFAILHQLRDLGIRIAMDDFGTGYSSLGYLRSFPFDKIKIDQSFIQDLPGKEESLAIVRAVVGLSSSLGITTTAEGVETKEQLASLASEGCNEFQGFLFSKPRPAAEVARILKEAQRTEAAV